MTSRMFPALPKTNFWLGHLPEMQREPYKFYLRYHAKYGGCLRFDAFPGTHFYSFADPDALHHILVTQRAKYNRGKRWRHIVGLMGSQGLITSTGDFWQKQRQCMAPSFHSKAVDASTQAIAANTTELIRQWQSLPDDAVVNISESMMYLGLANISSILLGYDIRQDAKPFSEAMLRGFAYLHESIINPLSLPLFLPTRRNQTFKDARHFVDQVAYQIIYQKRKEGDDTTLLGSLIQCGHLNDQQIRDEIVTLLMAGHDTVASALAWAWHLLARHPKVLSNLRDELKSVLNGRIPGTEDIEKLKYTRMVFEETLRLYPSVWAMQRTANETDEVLGYPVKKGSELALSLYVTHRNPAYWEKPETFYPEHFNAEAVARRPRYAFLPFGSGERVCIGAPLAMTEGILTLAILCQAYSPTVTDLDIKPTIAFTLKPNKDIKARLKNA